MIEGLIKQSKKGVFALFSGQVVKVAVQIINLVVLARLLSPEDYGLTAVAIAIVGLGEIVRDFGLSTASIQADTLSHAEKSNLFWLNTAIGLFLTCVVFILSPFIAVFYNEPRLELIIKSMSIIFFLNGITTQFKAGLSRDLKFKSISFSEVSASVLSTSVAIYAAYLGYGFWAIVFQQVALNLLLLLAYVNYYRWLPSLPDFSVSISSFINYGKNLMGSQILGQLSRSFDTFVIGHQFGSELLGLYNRAYQIVFFGLLQINSPASTLAIPVLSKLKNNDEEYYRFLLFGQTALLHVVCFAFGIFAINAEFVIHLVLGAKWLSALLLVQILCLGAVFHVACYSTYWIFVSQGLSKQQFNITLYTRPTIMLFIFLGASWNINTVAIGVVIGLLYVWLHTLYYLKSQKIKTSLVFKNSAIICSSYIFCTCVSILFDYFVEFKYQPLLNNLLFVICFISIILFSKYFRESLINVFKLFNHNLLSKR